MKRDPFLETQHPGSLFRDLQRLVGKIDGCDLGTGPRKIHRIRADAAADFQDPLPTPTLELGKAGNVRLYKIFPLLHFIEVLAGTQRLLRMANIAWTRIPIGLDGLNIWFNRRFHDASA